MPEIQIILLGLVITLKYLWANYKCMWQEPQGICVGLQMATERDAGDLMDSPGISNIILYWVYPVLKLDLNHPLDTLS